MKIINLFIYLIFTMNLALAQEVSVEVTRDADDRVIDVLLTDPFLSLKYQRGAHLVYDCFDKNWVCTGKPEFNNCLDIRKYADSENFSKMPCASVKIFKSEKICNKVQTRLTDSAYATRFCKSKEIREKDRLF